MSRNLGSRDKTEFLDQTMDLVWGDLTNYSSESLTSHPAHLFFNES